jgi:ABC-type multidrug transport system fused ATPase/permease subunit
MTDTQGVEIEGGRILDDIKGDINFSAVQFAYPLRKHEPVLQSINLNVPAGSTLVSNDCLSNTASTSNSQ